MNEFKEHEIENVVNEVNPDVTASVSEDETSVNKAETIDSEGTVEAEEAVDDDAVDDDEAVDNGDETHEKLETTADVLRRLAKEASKYEGPNSDKVALDFGWGTDYNNVEFGLDTVEAEERTVTITATADDYIDDVASAMLGTLETVIPDERKSWYVNPETGKARLSLVLKMDIRRAAILIESVTMKCFNESFDIAAYDVVLPCKLGDCTVADMVEQCIKAYEWVYPDEMHRPVDYSDKMLGFFEEQLENLRKYDTIDTFGRAPTSPETAKTETTEPGTVSTENK